jgi:hypothetical protein
MAASSPLGIIRDWNTTPNDPFPTILHWVYEISFCSPVTPSWTFSRMTSVRQEEKMSASVLGLQSRQLKAEE